MHNNSVVLIGNLGDDPEITSMESGDRKAKLRIATSQSWKDGDGNRQERTDWHNVVVWRKWADKVEGLRKGDKIIILGGEIQTRSWEDRDGNKKYATEISVPPWPQGEIYKAEGLFDDDRGGRGGGRGGDRDRGGSRGGGRDDDRGGSRDRGGRDDRSARGRDDDRDRGRDDRGNGDGRRDTRPPAEERGARPAQRSTARDLDDEIPFN